MNNYYYWRIVLDWVPFVIFIGLMIFFMKKGFGGKQAAYMDFMKDYCTNHLEETRKINANLARIAAAAESKAANRDDAR